MKRLIFALIILLFVASANAASIDVQESIPANTVWSFSVTLPTGTNFNNADVLLDGIKLISFETVGSSQIITAVDPDSSRLFSSTESADNTVYFLVSPLRRGNHDIVLKIDDSTADEKSVDFFEIYGAEERADLQSQITGLHGSLNTLVEQFNSIEESLGSALNEEDKQALQANIDSLQSLMSEIEAGLEKQDADSLTKIIALNGYLNDLQVKVSEDANPAVTGIGMVSLGSVGPEAQTGILFIIVAIVATILVVKFKDKIPKKGLYGKTKKEASVFSQHDEDIANQVLSESQDEVKSGRWAIEGAKPVEKPERKRFNVGDLLRKD